MNAFRLPMCVLVGVLTVTSVGTFAQRGVLKHFAETDDGRWRTVVNGPNGEQTEFFYEPANRFVAAIRSQWVVEDAPTATIRYTYDVANAAQSPQQVADLHFGPGMPRVREIEGPGQWLKESNPEWVMFAAADADPPTTGIAPGNRVRLGFTATNLPGVVTVRMRGNVAVLRIPEGFDTELFRELDALKAVTQYSDVQAIGPIISIETESSEESINVVTSRIVAHYSAALAAAQHPKKVALIRALQLAQNSPNPRMALVQVKQLASEVVTEAWHRELSRALVTCVDVLLAVKS